MSCKLPFRTLLGAIVNFGAVIPLGAQVVINEIHYQPAGASSNALEYVELRNISAGEVDLGGWALSEGVEYVFPPGVLLSEGALLVVSPDPETASSAYGIPGVHGPYTGRLDNGGEIVGLIDSNGRSVSRVHYEDEGAWPSTPDGLGPSLEYTGNDGANDLPSRWAPSLFAGGTPGAPNSRTQGSPAPAVIRGILNEVRPGAGGGDTGFLEVFNPTGVPLSLGGYVVSFGGAERLTLPGGPDLPPGIFRAFTGAALGGILPNRNDVCMLLAPDGKTFVDAMEVRSAPAGSSSARFPDGGDDVFVTATTTQGTPNAYVPFTDVVINEIHYHPPYVPPAGACVSRCSDAEQWIELWNRSGADVDLGGWSLTKGVEIVLPAGARIRAGNALVIAANVARFQAENPGVTDVVGGWTGRLAHDTDTINLRDALGNRVDHVKYGDGGPRNDEEPRDGIDDRTFLGSAWPPQADGTGRTLELIHPGLDNRSGHAWRASALPGGTPGAQNSAFDATPTPVIDAVKHSPSVPRSSDTVRVTARISSIQAITSATLEWSPDGQPLGTAVLHDDGVGADSEAGDGEFAATIAARPDGTVIRFRIIAASPGGSLTVPVPPDVPPYLGFSGPFFLYEVDDSAGPQNGLATYRVVMRASDLAELDDRPLESDVLLPATFISGNEVHYLCGVRYRGETSRREPNRSYRIEFPAEDGFEGVDDLNLNGSNGGNFGDSNVRDLIAADLFRRAGSPYPQIYPINMHFPGEVDDDFDSRYIRKENYDQDFLSRFFGGSDGGNLYRGLNPEGVGSDNADFQYLGPDPAPYRALYDKRSNEEADDYSDIIALTRVFDPVETPDAAFPAALESWIDSVQWAEFFAMQALLNNNDGGIWNNNGEDYFLYRVPPQSTRPDAGKFLLLPWDMEETLAGAGETIFAQEVPAIRRFLRSPAFIPLYYDALLRLREGPFSRLEMRTRYGHVAAMFPSVDVFNIVDPIDTYVTNRIGFLDLNIPSGILVGPESGPVSGTTLIAPGDDWRFFRGASDPPGALGDWTKRTYSAAAWETGPTGIGYADGDDQTTLDDMENSYTTVFTRKTFQLADPSSITGLTLLIRYDDAFIAYVNGVEAARSDNAPGQPGDPVLFDATASGTHEADGGDEAYELPMGSLNLIAGTNVLAVCVLNNTVASSDLSFIPTLIATESVSGQSLAGGCGGPIYATGSDVMLSGIADPRAALSVTANGVLAESSFVTSGPGPYGIAWRVTLPLPAGTSMVTVRLHSGEGGGGAVVASEEIEIHKLTGSFAQVGGPLQSSTSWTAAGGPYRLTSNVVVPAGITLTIGPGAVVLGNDRVAINVAGRLVADGTSSNPIRFSAFQCSRPWGGIHFQNTGTGAAAPGNVLRGVIVEHGTAPQGAAGVVTAVMSKLLVEDSTFRQLSENAIDVTDGRLEVRGSSFEKTFEAVHTTRSVSQILDSTFRNLIGDNDAIDFDDDFGERSEIARCLIDGSSDDGIDLAFATVDIHDNVIIAAGDKAISVDGDGPLGPITLARNVIVGSGTGIALKQGANVVDAHHLTVSGCQEGFNFFAKDAGPAGGHGTFDSSIVWGNITDVKLDARSSVSFTYSDVGGTGVKPGTGNINASPRFADPDALDYALAGGSPCIGTGRDGTDMGAIPFTGGGFTFIRGDSNLSGSVDISDPITTLNVLFLGQAAAACPDVYDGNDDGAVNISDPVYVLRFLFQGGEPIPAPYPDAGPDPSADDISC